MLREEGQRWVKETHLDVDLDGKWDAFFQLFGFLIEVLAELPDGDPFLHFIEKKER